MSILDHLKAVEAEARHLLSAFNLDTRRVLEAELAAAKRLAAEAETDLIKVKADAEAELGSLKTSLAEAVKDAAPEVKAAVEAAVTAAEEKILSRLS